MWKEDEMKVWRMKTTIVNMSRTVMIMNKGTTDTKKIIAKITRSRKCVCNFKYQ